ncbi:hypothetical protein LTR15_000404 [Elasticomyces elasticus]|nr:hypothetical protein LTR15_000404 [Elasticomyces elasticus]
MVRNGGCSVSLASRDEKLIVKWKTCGKTKHRDPTGGVYRGRSGKPDKDPMDRIIEFIAGSKDSTTDIVKRSQEEQEQEFTGLFVFEFDEKGRIVKHVIEHTDEGGRWDRTKSKSLSWRCAKSDPCLGEYDRKTGDRGSIEKLLRYDTQAMTVR